VQAQFPFLDENVIQTLLDIPLWEIAKLDEPVGKGDNKILRGLHFDSLILKFLLDCTSNPYHGGNH
jgi:hypothetical protein